MLKANIINLGGDKMNLSYMIVFSIAFIYQSFLFYHSYKESETKNIFYLISKGLNGDINSIKPVTSLIWTLIFFVFTILSTVQLRK